MTQCASVLLFSAYQSLTCKQYAQLAKDNLIIKATNGY